jgi:hypothetical protein
MRSPIISKKQHKNIGQVFTTKNYLAALKPVLPDSAIPE